MIGIIVALVTALGWAGSSIILKYLSPRVDAVSINMMRLWVGSIILASFAFLSGRGANLVQSDSVSILLVATSGLVAIAAGDTIYVRSLSFLDVSRAYPIAQCTFPVLALFAAILFLGESFAWFNILGAALVVLGIYLISQKDRRVAVNKLAGKGVALALVAAVLWAGGSVTLKLGVTGMDSIVAAAIRIPAAAVALTIFSFSQRGRQQLQFTRYAGSSVILMVSAGILTYGVGAVGYVVAMQLIGVGKTVLLVAAAPLFLLPLSVLILKERPTSLALAGVFVSVAGMCLVAL